VRRLGLGWGWRGDESVGGGGEVNVEVEVLVGVDGWMDDIGIGIDLLGIEYQHIVIVVDGDCGVYIIDDRCRRRDMLEY